VKLLKLLTQKSNRKHPLLAQRSLTTIS